MKMILNAMTDGPGDIVMARFVTAEEWRIYLARGQRPLNPTDIPIERSIATVLTLGKAYTIEVRPA